MHKGYTLLEVMMVVTILLIVLGGGMISFTRYNAQRSIDRDLAAFTDVLSIARQKTIDRDLGNTTNCSTFIGYQVQVSVATSSYQLFRLCSGVTIPVIATYQLDKTAFDPSSASTIEFEYPYGTLKGGAEQTVILRNATINQCKQLRISVAGIISEQSC